MLEQRLPWNPSAWRPGGVEQHFLIRVLLLVSCLAVCATCRHMILPEQPEQPSSGPGGAEYRHAGVNISGYGQEETAYWIFEPASPTPEFAPLVVFLHGWIAVNPQNYGAWIDHIVGRGAIVVYPSYQVADTPAEEMTQNAITAVKDAIEELQNGLHITPQLDRFALVAHSLGGSIAANMAAQASLAGLPEPKALMLAEPGLGEHVGSDILADLSSIPPSMLMLVVVGSEDRLVGSETAREIFKRTPQIPLASKDFITVVSDRHGEPPLVADHFAPAAPDDRYDLEGTRLKSFIRGVIQKHVGSEVNAMDYYCFWKLFDGITETAFYGKDRIFALGNTPEQRYMGVWSDGTPVAELRITDNP